MDWLTPQIFITTILGVLGAQVGLFLAMMKLQERYTVAQIETLKKQVETVQSNNEESSDGNISIKIVQPSDWKTSNGKPKRKEKSRYEIGPIIGTVSGDVKSAFLAIRTSTDGELRVLKRLSIEKDRAWVCTIEIPAWETSKTYEIVGVAFAADLPLVNETRITKESKPVLSNSIPVSIVYESGNT